jgi:hypothetical protein
LKIRKLDLTKEIGSTVAGGWVGLAKSNIHAKKEEIDRQAKRRIAAYVKALRGIVF